MLKIKETWFLFVFEKQSLRKSYFVGRILGFKMCPEGLTKNGSLDPYYTMNSKVSLTGKHHFHSLQIAQVKPQDCFLITHTKRKFSLLFIEQILTEFLLGAVYHFNQRFFNTHHMEVTILRISSSNPLSLTMWQPIDIKLQHHRHHHKHLLCKF